jgi:hypothetical protein
MPAFGRTGWPARRPLARWSSKRPSLPGDRCDGHGDEHERRRARPAARSTSGAGGSGGRKPARSAASRPVSTRGTGADGGASSASSVGVCVSATLAISVDGLTIRAAFIAGLAMVALLLTGWRKPARAEPRSPRGPLRRDPTRLSGRAPRRSALPRPGIVRRVLAALASAGIGVLTGVLAAIVTAFAIAVAVIWMTNLLDEQ